MVIPSLWTDFGPAYFILGLLVIGRIFSWAWNALGIGPFLEKWLVADDPNEHLNYLRPESQLIAFPEQPSSRMCVISLDDKDDEPMLLKVIPGHACPPGTANRSAEEIRVRENLEQTSLPEFILEWSRQKNDAETNRAIREIYGDSGA